MGVMEAVPKVLSLLKDVIGSLQLTLTEGGKEGRSKREDDIREGIGLLGTGVLTS